MFVQAISTSYLNMDSLMRLLISRFGSRDYNIEQRDDKWIVNVPRKLTRFEINQARTNHYANSSSDEDQKSSDERLLSSSPTPVPTSIEITTLESSNLDSFTLALSNNKLDIARALRSFPSSFSKVHVAEVAARSKQGIETQRTIAIKIMRPNTEPLFEAEAAALTRLAKAKHICDNVIQLLAEPFERNRERAFFLPLADFNLEELLLGNERNVLFFDTSLQQQLDQLVHGLASIHQEDIFHGDLKPENILVLQKNDRLQLMIADFGHSKCDELTATRANLYRIGGAYPLNPSYSPPEMWKEGIIDLKPCDVWALGCIILETAAYLQGGHQSLRAFRDLRQSGSSHTAIATFHDNKHLKAELRKYIQSLASQSMSTRLSVVLTGMLHHDPTQRLSAASAYEELLSKHSQTIRNSEPTSAKFKISEYFLSIIGRVHRLAVNSGWSIAQVTAFFAVPIFFSALVIVLAAAPALSSKLLDLTKSAPLIGSVVSFGSIFSVLKYKSIHWLIKSVRILLELDAECPFPECRNETSPRTYEYPQEWLNHLAIEHSAVASQSRKLKRRARKSNAQTSGRDQSTSTPAQRQSTQADTSMQGQPPSEVGHHSGSNVLLALDLCLPEPATKAIYRWQDLDFKSNWEDQTLFRDLAEKYFTRPIEPLLLPHHKLYVQVATWLSFTQLSRISPTRFYIIQDYMGNGNKALCYKLVSSESTLPPILNHYSTQQYLAYCIHKAWKNRNMSLGGLDTGNLPGSYFIGLIRLLARNKHPLPSLGYEGDGLEFVESLNLQKLFLQLIVVLAISIISGTVAGVLSGSLERGFVVGALGISLSQLLVAALVFVVPPPQHSR